MTENKSFQMSEIDAIAKEFRDTFGYPTASQPSLLNQKRVQQHISMIRDEFEKELIPALESEDLVEIYDAGLDVIVYIQNLLGEMGLPLQPGLIEVGASNMSKLDPKTGLPIKASENDPSGEPEGKTLKGENYFEPRLGKILDIMTQKTPLFTVHPFTAEAGDDEIPIFFDCALCSGPSVEMFMSTELRSHAEYRHGLSKVRVSLDFTGRN